jgi:hypothetical protein
MIVFTNMYFTLNCRGSLHPLAFHITPDRRVDCVCAVWAAHLSQFMRLDVSFCGAYKLQKSLNYSDTL